MTQYYYNPANNSYSLGHRSNPYEFLVYPDFVNGFYVEKAYNIPVYKVTDYTIEVSHFNRVAIKRFVTPMIPVYLKDAYFISLNQYGQPQTYQYQLPLMEVPAEKFDEIMMNIEDKESTLSSDINGSELYNPFGDPVWKPISESDDSSSDDSWPDIIGDAAGV